MIGVVTKGNSFKGIIDYLLKKEGNRILHKKGLPKSNSRKDLANSMTDVAKKNTNTKIPVKHFSLSFHPKDGEVNDKTKIEIAQEIVKNMGFLNNQFIVVAHPREKETENQKAHNFDHIHIAVNRIDKYGCCVSDTYDKRRFEKIIREVEKKYNLTKVAPSWSKNYKSLSSQDYHIIQKDVRQEKKSNTIDKEIGRAELTAAIDKVTEDKPKLSVFLARLKHLGIKPELYITTGKRCKISYYFPKYQKRNGEPYKYNRGIQNSSIDKLEKIREVDFGSSHYQSVKNIIDRGIPKIDKSQLIEWKNIDKHKYLMKDIKELLKEKGLDRSRVRSIDNFVSSIDNHELPIIDRKTDSEPISQVLIDNPELEEQKQLEELTKQFLHIKFNKRIESKFFFKGKTEFQNNTYLIEATREHFLDRKDDLTELNLKISKQLYDDLKNILTASASFENGETDIEMVSNLTNEEIKFMKNIVIELQNEHNNVVNRIEEVEDRSIDKKESDFEID